MFEIVRLPSSFFKNKEKASATPEQLTAKPSQRDTTKLDSFKERMAEQMREYDSTRKTFPKNFTLAEPEPVKTFPKNFTLAAPKPVVVASVPMI